jgi:septation ring formation regulator EzrA
MTADTKSTLDHLNDTVSQLKEMRHYAKNNVERLTAQWMLFDGELKKLKQSERIEQLMQHQGELYDELEADITAFEELVVEMTPKVEEPDEAASGSTQH